MATIDSLTVKATPLGTDKIELNDGQSATLSTLPVSTAQAAADAAVSAASLQKSANLSDLASAATARTNLGLGNVDNTADADKPVSTAQAAAIALKLDASEKGADGGVALDDLSNDGAQAAISEKINFASGSLGAVMAARVVPPLSSEVPNVTVTGPGGSNPIVGGVTYPHDTTSVNRIGCYPVAVTQFTVTYHQNQVNGQTGTGAQPWAVEFDTGAADIVMPFRPAASTARLWVWVNGRPITQEGMSFTGATISAGSQTWLRLRFGWAARRRIRIYLINCDFGGVTVPATYDIVANPVAETLKVAIVGDSWGINSGSMRFPEIMSWQLGRMMGAQPFLCSISGSGYVAGTTFANSARTTPLYAVAPDYIVVPGSINDNPYHASVQAAATAYFAAIATNLPNAQIIVAGPQPVPSGYETSTNLLANRDAVRAAALAASNVLTFIDPIEERWIWGSGQISAPAGDGNADIYIGNAAGNDPLHPSRAGGCYYAARIAERWQVALDSEGILLNSTTPATTPTAPALP